MNDQYAVIITEHAKRQMKDIYQYICYALQSPDIAQRWLDVITKEIGSLSFMPERLKVVDEKPWNQEEIRKLIIKNYYVYFWIDSLNNEVWVTAVTYRKRNQKEQLVQM